MYIAHSRKESNEVQLLKDHLVQTAELSGNFGKKLHLEKTCYLAGLLHDLGKYSDEFQDYLRKAISGCKSAVRGSVDHSTAGEKLLYDCYHLTPSDPFAVLLAELVGNAIVSHHSGKGLKDFLSPDHAESNYLQRVKKQFKADEMTNFSVIKHRFFEEVLSVTAFEGIVEQAKAELEALYIKGGKSVLSPNSPFYLLKFIYSCLLDADRTNTMHFELNMDDYPVDTHQILGRFHRQLEEKMASFTSNTPINQLRGQLSSQCKGFAERETGIYTLSIPTGGGKTLASLRFALSHALKHQKDRIIYVIPYTSIIEQNSTVVRQKLSDERHILEHHSNVTDEKKVVENSFEEEEIERVQALYKDNWEAPIIFTTMVQFLDTIYSRGTRNPRRFHNLINAVLIFDEAQSVPIKCTYLFNEVLNFLRQHGNTTSVLCTATQPALEYVGRSLKKTENGEMITQLSEIEEQFRRVELIDKTKQEAWKLAELVEFARHIITEKTSLLIILNTKTAVRKFYQLMAEQTADFTLYHLSTSMCAAHRKVLLTEIRDNLKKSKRVLCVTTALIEAGVDISFQSVIRSAAGLASIAQAAGRCNRHGEEKTQPVYVVNLTPQVEKLDKLPEIQKGQEITLSLLREYRELQRPISMLLTHQGQREYFKRYYQTFESQLSFPVAKKNFALHDLVGLNKAAAANYTRTNGSPVKLALKCSPETIAQYFEVIDSPTKSVLVPYRKGKELIALLNGELLPSEYSTILKQAQQYTVNVFSHELAELQKNAAINPLLNGEIYGIQENAYSEEFGLDIAAEGKFDYLQF